MHTQFTKYLKCAVTVHYCLTMQCEVESEVLLVDNKFKINRSALISRSISIISGDSSKVRHTPYNITADVSVPDCPRQIVKIGVKMARLCLLV